MSGTAARRAPSAPASARADKGAPARWPAPRTAYWGGWTAAAESIPSRANSGRIRVGLLRQAAYVAIDVAMVMLGGAMLDLLLSQAHLFASLVPALSRLL